jgi:GNAT superfamily N-acetyltransferase
MLTIRTIRADDLPILKDFAPPDWNTDLSVTFAFHLGQPYFYAILAEWDGVIAGCANGLLQGQVGWLGNIIVLPAFRGRGIGSALTHHLVEFFQRQGISHQLLIATQLGQPVYEKTGFKVGSHYLFFKRGDSMRVTGSVATAVTGVRAFAPEDAAALFALDQSISGELRQPFLSRFLDGAWVHTSTVGELDGYYLPKLGNGLVIAADDTAGLALLRLKLAQRVTMAVVPEQNLAAVDFYRSVGMVESARAPRMSLGGEVSWQPEHVYARGSGFCG